MIRAAESQDASAIADIYNYYVDKTIVTFEESAVSAQEIQQRIADTASDGLPWLVALDSETVVGYAYASKWKGRCAYRFAVEVTVYLSPTEMARGWGSALYKRLFDALRDSSIHTVIGGIALPNPGSIALHEKFGMRKVGEFREVGYKFDKWVDVGYWQGSLNHR